MKRHHLFGLLGLAVALSLAQSWVYADGWDAQIPNEPYTHPNFPGMQEGLWPPGTNWPGYKDEVAGKQPKSVKEVLIYWPKTSRKLASSMISKYGQPSRISREALEWDNNGPWLKTIVFRESSWIDERRLVKGNILQQTARRAVKPESVDALADFDTRVVVDREQGTLTSTSPSEELNFLALNLADDVAQGKKTPEQATALYYRTADLSVSGKSSPLMRKLMFPAGN